MDFTKISDSVLLERLEKLVRTERKITHVILSHINEVESRRLFADLGFESMYQYLNKHLGYAEDSAYRRLKAASLLREVPQIAVKIESGALNLTQLTQVQKCLRVETKAGQEMNLEKTERILEQIENKNSYETLKVLAVEFNQPVQSTETLKPQSDGSNRLAITFSDEELETLKQAKDLLSHVLPDGNWKDLFVHWAKKEIKTALGKDSKVPELSETMPLDKNRSKNTGNSLSSEACLPLTTAEPNTGSSVDKSCNRWAQNSTQSFLVAQKRKPVKITTRRILLKKADHCCEFVNQKTAVRCSSRYQLQVDHKIPLAKNGSNDVSNLRVLCRTHNLLAARQWGVSVY